MNYYTILLFLLILFLLINSAWSLTTLKKVENNTPLSTRYVSISKITAITTLILSFLLLAIFSIDIYRRF